MKYKTEDSSVAQRCSGYWIRLWIWLKSANGWSFFFGPNDTLPETIGTCGFSEEKQRHRKTGVDLRTLLYWLNPNSRQTSRDIISFIIIRFNYTHLRTIKNGPWFCRRSRINWNRRRQEFNTDHMISAEIRRNNNWQEKTTSTFYRKDTWCQCVCLE